MCWVSLGKDATLTGRTLIWRRALDSISEHLIAGLGYAAFWQVGSWSVEQVWYFMKISNKMAFHFHDTYLHIAVYLGVIGMLEGSNRSRVAGVAANSARDLFEA